MSLSSVAQHWTLEDTLAERQRLDGSRWAFYRRRPVDFIREVLGEQLWSKQVEIIESVQHHRRTAVPSAHECSKSFTAARIVAWWLAVHRLGEAFAVTTAPTATQVRSILWREIGRAYRQGRLPGRINQTEWFMLPSGERYTVPRTAEEELVAFGRKPSDYDPAAFQGIHARYVLVVLDEACGIPEELWRAAGSLAANEHSRILAIGNPDDPQSHFAKVCQPGSDWHVVHVDGLQSPNFTDGEGLPQAVLEQLLSRVYEQELREEVGEQSAIYLSKVRGLFPEDTTDGVVPLSWVRKCQRLERMYKAEDLLPVGLGVDVGAGGDETVIRERRGPVAGRTWRARTPDFAQAAGMVMQAIAETGATEVKVDVIGIGWGLVGRLQELQREGKHKAEIVGVNVAEASSRPDKFPKLRDQLWWEIGRELSRGQGWDLSAVDEKTIAQLIAPTYRLDSAGRVAIERKEDTRKRLGRSPDDADALLLAFCHSFREELHFA